MGLRLRSLRYGVIVFAFFAIAALPGTWTHQIPGSTLGPAIAWAGGTPDETLNPPPTPPPPSGGKKSGDMARTATDLGSEVAAVKVGGTSVGSRWVIYWLALRATVLRI